MVVRVNRVARTGVRLLCAAAVSLSSCGGASNANGPDAPREGAQSCSPNNPFRADALQQTSRGTLSTEKSWLRSYMDSSYLWYAEVPGVNAGDAAFSTDTTSGFYTSIDNYFNALLTPAVTASGKRKDQFSFTYPTRAWNDLINSGASAGWGIEWHFDTFTSSSITGVRVAFVHENSPAASAGFQRGDTLTSIGGVSGSATSASAVNTLLPLLFPASGRQVDFVFSRGGNPVNGTLTSTTVTLTPVQHQVLDVGGAKVGYLLFNDHVLTAEAPLRTAISSMRSAGVTDLVLDLRYNGGGYLYIASQLAYMIAGATATDGKVFESTVFNDKRTAENDVTGFFNTACQPNPSTFNCTSSAQLPTLDLPIQRVFVLASGDTCSASEAIINGLRGVNVDVRLIGSTTCGKPYGFFGQDNCGIMYFPIEFKGVNANNYGDYADGFVPDATGDATNLVRGCDADDDLDHALGNPAEGQLAAALYLRANGQCPPVASQRRESAQSARAALRPAGRVVKPVGLTNRNGRMPTR
jgi:hypothetical protein